MEGVLPQWRLRLWWWFVLSLPRLRCSSHRVNAKRWISCRAALLIVGCPPPELWSPVCACIFIYKYMVCVYTCRVVYLYIKCCICTHNYCPAALVIIRWFHRELWSLVCTCTCIYYDKVFLHIYIYINIYIYIHTYIYINTHK